MTWVKVDDAMPDHPSWVGISDAALGAWLKAACYSARRKLDGNLPTPYVRGIAKKVRDELLERERIHEPGDACIECIQAALKRGAAVDQAAYYIHAFLEKNPSKSDHQAAATEARDRMSKLRAERNGSHAHA